MTGASDRSVVITGASGFIGGRLAERYAAAGRKVAAVDLPGRPAGPGSEAAATRIAVDLADGEAARAALAGLRPGLVVHCAALMGGWGPPETYRRVNVEGTRNVAEWAAAAGADHLVYISSVTVYGMPPREGIDEEAPFRHIGLPYADSKMEAEALIRNAHEAGLPCTILRPGDVYGPRATEWVVKLVDSMKAGKMVLIGGGRGLVNTTHVDNLADAVEASETTPAPRGRAYNITDGPPVTWKLYLEALADAAGCAAPRISIPTLAAWPAVILMETAGRVLGKRPPLSRMGLRLLTARCSYSIERARRELDWSPRVDLRRGMDGVRDWLAGSR